MLLMMNWLLMNHVKMHVVDVERQHHYQVVIQLNPVEPKPQAQLVAMNFAIVEKQNYVPNLNEYLRVCYSCSKDHRDLPKSTNWIKMQRIRQIELLVLSTCCRNSSHPDRFQRFDRWVCLISCWILSKLSIQNRVLQSMVQLVVLLLELHVYSLSTKSKIVQRHSFLGFFFKENFVYVHFFQHGRFLLPYLWYRFRLFVIVVVYLDWYHRPFVWQQQFHRVHVQFAKKKRNETKKVHVFLSFIDSTNSQFRFYFFDFSSFCSNFIVEISRLFF